MQSISEPRGCLVPNAQKSGGPTAKTIDGSVSAQDTHASSWEKKCKGICVRTGDLVGGKAEQHAYPGDQRVILTTGNGSKNSR